MALLILQHSDSATIDRLGTVLNQYGHRQRTVMLHRGEPVPTDLDDVDGIVVLGGPQSANGDESWLAPEMELLRAAHASECPVLGLCLGSQILGRALGGTVSRMDGPEIGWHEITLSPVGREDPLFAGLPWRHQQAHWHRDQVEALPPGARLLASSEACPNQAWAIGVRTYAIQFHPEIDFAAFERWGRESPEDLRDAGLTADGLREQSETLMPEFVRLTTRLFESLALFLMPVDRRYHGIAKDLHH